MLIFMVKKQFIHFPLLCDDGDYWNGIGVFWNKYRYDLRSVLPHTSIASQVDDLGWLKDLLKVYHKH